MVLQGSDFDQLQKLGYQMLEGMRDSPMFYQPRLDPSPTKPQLDVRIDRAKAADLNVPISEIAATLETLFGGKRVTTFQRGSQEYDVVVQVADEDRTTPSDLSRVYVKSTRGQLIQLTNLGAGQRERRARKLSRILRACERSRCQRNWPVTPRSATAWIT